MPPPAVTSILTSVPDVPQVPSFPGLRIWRKGAEICLRGRQATRAVAAPRNLARAGAGTCLGAQGCLSGLAGGGTGQPFPRHSGRVLFSFAPGLEGRGVRTAVRKILNWLSGVLSPEASGEAAISGVFIDIEEVSWRPSGRVAPKVNAPGRRRVYTEFERNALALRRCLLEGRLVGWENGRPRIS